MTKTYFMAIKSPLSYILVSNEDDERVEPEMMSQRTDRSISLRFSRNDDDPQQLNYPIQIKAKKFHSQYNKSYLHRLCI